MSEAATWQAVIGQLSPRRKSGYDRKFVKAVTERVGGAMTDMSGGGDGGRRSVKVKSNGGGQSGDGLLECFLKAYV
ncbi:hypothetical protein Tco_0175107 [Tanacetum coccineum]